MDVGKLGDKELDDLTTKSFNALTSVSITHILLLDNSILNQLCVLKLNRKWNTIDTPVKYCKT